MGMALESLELLYRGRARMARVDVKALPGPTVRYGITCLPTVLVFERGRVVRRFLGTAFPWEIEAALREFVQPAA
jgi:thioredoxin-like negative regulator of GroEL